jgi:large subunit ribosomal protein L25
MDFLRVSKNEKIRVKVPLHCINEDVSVGVKQGGVVTHNMVDIEVSCLPGDLPEFIEVDLEEVGLGESVHLSDIKMPSGTECVTLAQAGDHNLSVVSIAAAKVSVEVETVDTEVEDSSEPE